MVKKETENKIKLPTFEKGKIPKWAERSIPIGLVFHYGDKDYDSIWLNSDIIGYIGFDKITKKRCIMKFPTEHSLGKMFCSYAEDYHNERKGKLNKKVKK